MRLRSWSAPAALAVAFGIPASASANLLGSSAVLDARFPSLANVIAVTGPATVSGAVEFPSFLGGAWTSDVTASQVILTQNASTNALGAASYNGFVYTFTGAPTIVGVSLDPSSNFTPTGLSFSANEVFINYAGYGLATAGLTTRVNVQFIPEPTAATALIGAATLAAARRRRR